MTCKSWINSLILECCAPIVLYFTLHRNPDIEISSNPGFCNCFSHISYYFISLIWTYYVDLKCRVYVHQRCYLPHEQYELYVMPFTVSTLFSVLPEASAETIENLSLSIKSFLTSPAEYREQIRLLMKYQIRSATNRYSIFNHRNNRDWKMLEHYETRAGDTVP